MDSMKNIGTALEDTKIDVKIRLSAMWASVMFCYIYADYFGLYVPGALQRMLAGQMGPLGPTTQGILLGTAVMMAIPSVMIVLSVALKSKLNRWLNIICGVIYTIVILITMWDWVFSIFFGAVEVALTALIAWHAWNWPKQETTYRAERVADRPSVTDLT